MRVPEISVMIPFYNVNEDFFDICLNSLLKQTYSNFEIIIVDDGSEEKYKNYLDRKKVIDQRIRIFHTENRGVSVARNFGISEAKGETICFVDADDYVSEWMIEDLWNIYEKNDVDAVVSYYNMVNTDDYQFQRNNTEASIVEASSLKDTALIGTNRVPESYGYLSAGPCAVLFDISLAKSIKFRQGIKYMEDVIWNYQFFSNCRKVAIVKECVYAYRQNNSSATHTYKLNMIDDRIKTLSLIESLCGGNNEWYALRVLANYSICCKCCMLTDELTSFRDRISRVKNMNKAPVWKAYKVKGVSKHWDRKYRIKRFLANSGLLPLYYSIHK